MFEIRKAILVLQAIKDNVRRPVNWFFYLLLVWSLMAGLLCCCHPRVSNVPQGIKAEHSTWFESKWPDLSRCQSPETHALAVGNVQGLWGQANASPHQVSESWSCAKSHRPGDKADGWMSSWMSYTRDLGEQRMGTGQGTTGWSYTTWKKVITRRGEYNQEIFWISGITILQASHNYCICIGYDRTLCQKKTW